MRIVWIFFLITTCSIGLKSTTIKNEVDEQIIHSMKFYNAIKSSNYSFIDSNYLTKSELELLRIERGDTLANSKSSKLLKNYESDKSYYIQNIGLINSPFYSKMGKYDSLSFDNAMIDSITYEYVLMKTEEKDVKITWPESKTFILPKNEMLACSSIIWFSESNRHYKLFFHMLRYEESWKFFRTLPTPQLVRLK